MIAATTRAESATTGPSTHDELAMTTPPRSPARSYEPSDNLMSLQSHILTPP